MHTNALHLVVLFVVVVKVISIFFLRLTFPVFVVFLPVLIYFLVIIIFLCTSSIVLHLAPLSTYHRHHGGMNEAKLKMKLTSNRFESRQGGTKKEMKEASKFGIVVTEQNNFSIQNTFLRT